MKRFISVTFFVVISLLVIACQPLVVTETSGDASGGR